MTAKRRPRIVLAIGKLRKCKPSWDTRDWCPQCHGTWLDGGGFEAISECLIDEAVRMPRQELEKGLVTDARGIMTGRPGRRAAELGDAPADLEALVNGTIFEYLPPAAFLERIPRVL